MTTAIQTLNHIELGDHKMLIRPMIGHQWAGYHQQCGMAANMLTLPGLTWEFEKLFKAICEKLGITIETALGVEFNPKLYSKAVKNLPFDACRLVKGDFDATLLSMLEWITAVWADYCGLFASYDPVTGERRYPHIDALVRYLLHCVETGRPGIYHATFMLTPRPYSGLQLYDGFDAKIAIENTIKAHLGKAGLTKHVKQIMNIRYNGGHPGRGNKKMLVLGYAVNHNPEYDTFVHDWATWKVA